MDILPDSRTREIKGRVQVKGSVFIPIYCANCGANGGGVPEEHITFAFYLCMNCVDKWGLVAGTYMEPDAVFFEKVKQAQLQQESLEKLALEAPKGR